MATKTLTAAERLSKADDAYRKAWEANRREDALAQTRSRAQHLEREVARHRESVAEMEAWLAELETMRAGFVEELQGLPEDTRHLTAQESDRIRNRRQQLRRAIAALDGDRPDGTLVDHLAVEGRPRIPGTRRRIEEERELLEEAERELAKVRRQLED